jgi:hypothetical protein
MFWHDESPLVLQTQLMTLVTEAQTRLAGSVFIFAHGRLTFSFEKTRSELV